MPFAPNPNGTVNLGVISSSGTVALGSLVGNAVRILNEGTSTVFVDIVQTAGTAVATTSMPVHAAAPPEIVMVADGQPAVAQAIGGTGTQTVYFTRGWWHI